MIDERVIKKIVRDLTRQRSRNVIITELCESSGLRWDQAERLVEEIEMEHGIDIYSRQKILLLMIGIVVALGGFIICGFLLVESLHGLVIYVGMVPVPFLGNIIFFVLGLGMIIGGLRGVFKLLLNR